MHTHCCAHVCMYTHTHCVMYTISCTHHTPPVCYSPPPVYTACKHTPAIHTAPHTSHAHCLTHGTQGTHTTHRAHIICFIPDHKSNAAAYARSPQSQPLQDKVRNSSSLPFASSTSPSFLAFSEPTQVTSATPLLSGHLWGFPDYCPAWPDESVTSRLSTKTLTPPTSRRERPRSKACFPSPSAPPPP